VTAAWHGTVNGYTNRKCRCSRCRVAWADWNWTRTRTREALLKADPSLAEHGKATTYGNWRCRCEPCTKAWRGAKAERKARLGPPLPRVGVAR
jgi:hypothetical protein